MSMYDHLVEKGVMPVSIVGSELTTEEHEPEHFVISSYVIPPIGSEQGDSEEQTYVSQAILQLDPLRKAAEILVHTLTPAPLPIQGATLQASGTVTSPALNAIVASIPAPAAGNYLVYVEFNMAGTPAQGTDNNNLQLLVNGASAGKVNNEIAPGEQDFGPFSVTTNGANPITLSVNPNAGTAGSIYGATLIAVPAATPAPLVNYGWLCHSEAQAQAQQSSPAVNVGGLVFPGDSFKINGTAPMWIVGASGSSLIVTAVTTRRGA